MSIKLKIFKMKSLIFTLTVAFLMLFNTNAQIKIRTNGSIHTGYSGYKNIYMGTYSSQGADNGEWGLEVWNGNINFWRPWPCPTGGNYMLYIRADNGNVGIGRNPSYKLDVNGDIATYGTFRISSDARLKKDINQLSLCKANLIKLNGKSYKKVQPQKNYDFKGETDSIKIKTILAEQEREAKKKPDNKTHFGFLAQEIQKVFPELVDVDSAGFFTVDYIGLIPIIIESIKEQDSIIKIQESQLKELQKLLKSKSNLKSAQISSNVLTDNISNCSLEQNSPNPFNSSTEIRYYVSDNVNTAIIYLFNMNGLQIKSYPLYIKGNGSIVINGSELQAGLYMYSLVVDNKEIDTKRLMLTK